MKLKNISGVMLGKEEHTPDCHYWRRKHSHDCNCGASDSSQALTEQGEVEVELDREKVIYLLDKEFCKQYPKSSNLMIAINYNNIPKMMDKLAQALSDNLPSILKVKK